MSDAELAEERKISHEKFTQTQADLQAYKEPAAQSSLMVKLAWLAVLVPISYGVWMTVQKAWVLFS
jgi:hypothetical protein